MRIMIGTLVGWAVFVMIGWLIMGPPAPRQQYVAVKDLRPNHRLVEGDVAEVGPYHRFMLPALSNRTDFHSRYVAGSVEKNHVIELEATLNGPRMAARAGSIAWVSLSELPMAERASLDVQDKIEMCNLDGKGSCGVFTVAAIACSDDRMTSCSAAIDVNPAQRRRLSSIATKAGQKTPELHIMTDRLGGSPLRGNS
jgi:hypothetical protein